MCSNENIVLFTPNFSLTFTLSPFTFAAHCDQAERSQREPRIKGRRQRRPAALNKRLDVFIVDACMVDNLPVFQIRIRCILVCAVSILLFRSIGCNGTLTFIFFIFPFEVSLWSMRIWACIFLLIHATSIKIVIWLNVYPLKWLIAFHVFFTIPILACILHINNILGEVRD